MYRKLKAISAILIPLSDTMAFAVISVRKAAWKIERTARKHPDRLLALIFAISAGITATMSFAARLVMQ